MINGHVSTPLLFRVLVVLLIAAAAAELDFVFAKAEVRTPVEHVTSKPRFSSRGLGTIEYQPSDQERPFFAKLEVPERITGGLAGSYELSGKDGVYVGWFGIVRNVLEDETMGHSTLLVEHKYFDGLTDSHIQALSFNGAGDFLAILQGTGHQIPPLSLVKVYGRASQISEGDLPRIEATFVRNWHWGTFTFLAAQGVQRGSEKWRRLNQIDLDDIYDPYPDDRYYEQRLGKRPEDALRRELFLRLAHEAASDVHLHVNAVFGDGSRAEPSGHESNEAVRSQDFPVGALRAATAVFPNAGPAVEPVIDAIVQEDLAALAETLKAVTSVQAEGAAIAVLAEALKHEKESIRILAAESLAELGFSARTIVPALAASLKDESKYVRNYAATALGNIGPEAQQAVPALLATLADEDSSVRANTCEALGKITVAAKYVVPALIAAINDRDSHVRWQAVGALGEFRDSAATATAVLRESLLHDEDSIVRWRSAEALAAVDERGQVAVPTLMVALKDKDATVRRFAARALGSLGAAARPTADALAEALHDEDTGARVAAAGALWKVMGDAQHSLPVLIRVLEQEKGIVRMWAADEMMSMGPEAKDAVSVLRQMLASVPPGWRSSALRALGNIGPDAGAAVPDLVELLDDKDGEIRAYAAGALWKINKDARAIPLLIEELRHSDYDMPYAAVVTVGEIGPPASEAVPDLIKTLSHRKLFVREEAARALKQIDAKSISMSAEE